jgi:hypothetical protein
VTVHQNARQSHNKDKVTSKSLAVKFRSVGTTGADQNYVQKELKGILNPGSASYHLVSIAVSPVRGPNSGKTY